MELTTAPPLRLRIRGGARYRARTTNTTKTTSGTAARAKRSHTAFVQRAGSVSPRNMPCTWSASTAAAYGSEGNRGWARNGLEETLARLHPYSAAVSVPIACPVCECDHLHAVVYVDAEQGDWFEVIGDATSEAVLVRLNENGAVRTPEEASLSCCACGWSDERAIQWAPKLDR